MTKNDFTLPAELHNEILAMDCLSQSSSEAIEGMADAIERLSEDRAIQAMAAHIKHLSANLANTVNLAAENLGANHRG